MFSLYLILLYTVYCVHMPNQLHTQKCVCKITAIIPHTQINQAYFALIVRII